MESHTFPWQQWLLLYLAVLHHPLYMNLFGWRKENLRTRLILQAVSGALAIPLFFMSYGPSFIVWTGLLMWLNITLCGISWYLSNGNDLDNWIAQQAKRGRPTIIKPYLSLSRNAGERFGGLVTYGALFCMSAFCLLGLASPFCTILGEVLQN